MYSNDTITFVGSHRLTHIYMRDGLPWKLRYWSSGWAFDYRVIISHNPQVCVLVSHFLSTYPAESPVGFYPLFRVPYSF